jgi:HD-GYP domain-containing protein (c-di-GMP phosphodiesterase class II)
MADYLPISLSSLRTNTVIGCDIYLLVQVDGSNRYVLYYKGNDLFERSKRELLITKNINKLFINKEDQERYSEYLQSNFQYVLSNGKVSQREKLKIVYNTGINIIQSTFENTNPANIEKTRRYAYNMVDFILDNVQDAYGFLRMQSHENYTYAHSVNVATMGTLFARNLGVSNEDLKQFCAAMLLYDLGKTKIGHDVLDKSGKLTDDEAAKMKMHPELGVSILKESGNTLKDENIITLQHHENNDGSGYPYGLKSNEIHPSAKIIRIIDIYDALTTKRPYADAQAPYDALRMIKNEMINTVDPIIFKRFIKFLGGTT